MQNNELLEMINQLDKQDFELSSDIKLLYDEIKNIEGSFDTSKIEKEIGTLKENISSIQLQKGDKGEKGEKGDKGKDGKNGKDGKDGRNGIDGLNGLNGKDGKDGSPDTPEQIVEKINKLENVIDIKTIKDFPKIEGTEDIKRQVDTIGNQVLRLLSKQQQSSGGGTWGSITGTLSNQIDLQNALNLKYDASNPAGYINSSALSGYTPTSRTITINGTTQDLSSNRSWTIPSGVSSLNTLTGALSITAGDGIGINISGSDIEITNTGSGINIDGGVSNSTYGTLSPIDGGVA